MEKTRKVGSGIASTMLASAVACALCFGSVAACAAQSAYAATPGEQTAALAAEASDIASLGIKDCGEQFYTGKAIEPFSGSIKVKIDGESVRITEGVDYEVVYANNVELGEASATIKGIGAYTGAIEKTFPIVEYRFVVKNEAGDTMYSLSRSELEALAVSSTDNTEPVKYQYHGSGNASAVYVPAKSYVTYESLMAYVGATDWSDAYTAASDGFGGSVAKEVNDTGKFYPAAGASNFLKDGAESVPAVLALKWASANVTTTCGAAAQAASQMDMDMTIRVFMGIPEDQFKADGDVAGKRFVSNVSNASVTGTFKSDTIKDSAGEWFTPYVAAAVNRGFFEGDRDGEGNLLGTFRPFDSITRADVAVILYRSYCKINPYAEEQFGSTTDPSKFATETVFADQEARAYYTAALNWAYADGIMMGDEPDHKTVRPHDNILRGELALVLERYGTQSGLGAEADGSYKDAPDAAGIEQCYISGVDWCYTNGIMTGSTTTGELSVMNDTLRGEVAKMIVALMQL